MSVGNCPICSSPSRLDHFGGDKVNLYEVGCLRCGKYRITDFTKDVIDLALQMDITGITQYLSKGDPSDYQPQTALCIEVARKAAAGNGGIDVPRSIISHVVRKRTDNRALLTCDILASVLKNNAIDARQLR